MKDGQHTALAPWAMAPTHLHTLPNSWQTSKFCWFCTIGYWVEIARAIDTNYFLIGKFWCIDMIWVWAIFLRVIHPYICSETHFRKISAEKFVVHISDPWECKEVCIFFKICSHTQGMVIITHNTWILGFLPKGTATGAWWWPMTPHLAQRLKHKWNNISTPPPCLWHITGWPLPLY